MSAPDNQRIRLAIHGGAGVLERGELPPERERACHDTLRAILVKGHQMLLDGASAADAAEQAVRDLEDSPLFNAGYGSVLNAEGEVEMDAAIMLGEGRRCGAVAAIRDVRHPISVARSVMETTPHVLIAGQAATDHARTRKLELAAPGELVTEDRLAQLESARKSGTVSLDHDAEHAERRDRMGTVGAVARDSRGQLAAATSTGGMTNKHPGRVGDSPIIGCGTFADARTCCVSATGEGEFFIRAAVASDVHSRMAYGRQNLHEAAAAALNLVAELGGSGGLIAIDAGGEIALPFNTSGMYRGSVGPDGVINTAIYDD